MGETDNSTMTDGSGVARGSGVSLWKQIAEAITAEIAEGRLAPGARLPTEAELAERFGVNRHTLRRALGVLTEQGVIEATPGRGTFVKEVPLHYAIGARTRFSEIVSSEGRAPGGRFLSSQREPAPRDIAERLKIPHGTELLRIEIVREADGVPVVCGTHWYVADRCKDLEFLVAATGSITRALEALGLGDYRRLETRVTARLADETERTLLALPAGRVVMVVESVNGDARRLPIQYTRSRFAADRVQLIVKS
ncbi:phosphonate metabolism transcriptional regulator PhnF [Ancylobacter sp. 6x-1]|uniref:Phosphonate metabolism transcriptional regulator PhnF n=1 Tax=Ancylobacter crimeensis TaxID=2579147 RepID=A0ABT0D9R0_9HYPH|nr:phosphonate metabolism transcriptional regulator PhnF [Ancylobacter crimeensis]MCK0196639.1 phosphonate metabolism transcriptional regulator PhnF [Ancylobacter crimeensis]